MKILVVGSGGREHALCWKIAQSPRCEKLYCVPGNAGISDVAECSDIAAEDLDGILEFAKSHAIDLVVVGPEIPLVAGLVDKLQDAEIKAFGPDSKAAILEGSKGYMKDMFARYNIPTAAYGRFTDRETAVAYVKDQGAPIVVKADGLAAGKGVTVCETVEQAIDAIDAAMNDAVFGDAGAELVIEEFLDGEEVSFFALVDGETALPLISAQDHKQVFDGDRGPNTGGMGAYSPSPLVTDEMVETIMSTIIQPTIDGMASEGRPFCGVLFAGLMVTDGEIKVLEYNVRFGDPECQVLMARLKSDLVEVLEAATDGHLDDLDLQWRNQAALTVVMAAQGYPGDYEKGSVIGGLETADTLPGVMVFHAGTKAQEGVVLANGGRVLGVTAIGDDVKAAQTLAYSAVDGIDWPGGFCRRDIGWRAV